MAAACPWLLLVCSLMAALQLTDSACSIIADCESCINTNICDQCKANMFKFNDGCVADCGAQNTATTVYYTDVAAAECLACHPTCDSCIGIRDRDCIKCRDTTGYLFEGKCIPSCPAQTIQEGDYGDIGGRVCRPCTEHCKLCSSLTSCSVCSPGFYLDANDKCVADCGLGFGEIPGPDSASGGTCVQCYDGFCESCGDGDEGSCLVCNSSKLLQDGLCVDSCDTGYFEDSSSGMCLRCAAKLQGCGVCDETATVCFQCRSDHYTDSLGECVSLTVCESFEYQSTPSTLTTDRFCSTCNRCFEGQYLSSPCLHTPGVCSDCLTQGRCASGQYLVGTCSHDHDAICKEPEWDDPAPEGRVIIKSNLTISSVLNDRAASFSTTFFKSALTSNGLGDMYLESFDVQTLSTSSLRLSVRIMPTLEEQSSKQSIFQNLLANPSPWIFALGADFQSSQVSATTIEVVSPLSGPAGISLLEVDSNQAKVLWAAVPPRPGLLSYELYVVHVQTGSTFQLRTSNTTYTLMFKNGHGIYRFMVSAVYDTSVYQSGRSLAAVLDIAAPACSEGCLYCGTSSCFSCNNITDNYQLVQDGTCFLPSQANSKCLMLGSQEFCELEFAFLIIGLCLVVLFFIVVVYCCCTHRRVVDNKIAAQRSNFRVKDVHFVAKWTQQTENYRSAMDQYSPMTLPILEAKLSSPSSLEAEFDSVPTNQAFPDELPPHVDDRNRDPNILPNIHSRVFLSVDQNSSRAETDEYINANFLRGYRGQDQAYIVTQAPSPPTVEPFWRMVWDQNVEVIVQLNGLVENGKLVGTRYWPTKSQWHTVIAYTNDGPSQKKTSVLTIGDFRIKLKSEKVFKNVVLTTLRVSRPGGSSRIVKHFWYLGLHPLKLPKSADDLHSFVADVRLQRRSRNPMVIHCVTGIERSSLFVGLDMIQNVMAAGQRVDILHILCQMRQDRGMLLDSVEKYRFLHMAAYEFYQRNTSDLRSIPKSEYHFENQVFAHKDEAKSFVDSLAEDITNGDGGYTEVDTTSERSLKKRKGRRGTAQEAEWSLSESESDGDVSELIRLPRRASGRKKSADASSVSSGEILSPQRSFSPSEKTGASQDSESSDEEFATPIIATTQYADLGTEQVAINLMENPTTQVRDGEVYGTRIASAVQMFAQSN